MTSAITGAAIVALLISMILILVRAFAGPTLFDRLLAVNSFGTKIILLIAIYGFFTGRPDFLDLALIYSLINFVGTIAALKFFEPEERRPVVYQEDDI